MLLTKMRPEFCLGCAPGYHEAPAQSASSLLRLLLSSGVNTAHQLLAKHSSFPTRNITRRYKFRENRSWLISRKTRLLWALLLLLLFSFLCLCVCLLFSPRIRVQKAYSTLQPAWRQTQVAQECTRRTPA